VSVKGFLTFDWIRLKCQTRRGILTWYARSYYAQGRHFDMRPVQMAVKNCFIRGSVVRYVQLPAEHVDTQLLEDATRRGRPQPILRYRCNSDCCPIVNRGRGSSQAVTSLSRIYTDLSCPFIIPCVPPICSKTVLSQYTSQPKQSIMCQRLDNAKL
jgi:hypothetical protein